MPTSDSRVIASQDLTTAGFNGLADSWATSRRIDSYSTYKIRDSFSEASNLVLANNDKVMITALDTGTHASSIGDVGVSGGQTPNSGYFYFNEGQNKLIRIAPLESEVAQRWAEGTLPGGAGTKSSKEWAEFIEALLPVKSLSAPVVGEYEKGFFVFNADPTVASNKILLGWSRLTTGSNNVIGTDWMAVYVSTI